MSLGLYALSNTGVLHVCRTEFRWTWKLGWSEDPWAPSSEGIPSVHERNTHGREGEFNVLTSCLTYVVGPIYICISFVSKDKPPTPLPPTDNVIMQDFSVNGSARFHTSNENMQYYSPRGSEENTRAPSRPSQRRSRDTSGHGETARETSRPSQRQTANASGYGENGRAPSTGRPSHGRSHDSSKRSSAAALQENHNGEVLKNDIVNSISKLRNEIGSLKDRFVAVSLFS